MVARREHTVKPLRWTKALDGFSTRQVSEHHDVLYAGYVKKLNEIELKLDTAPPADANGTFSLIGELKRSEGFATNAIKLHESYFDNLGGDGKSAGALRDMVIEDFGSYEKWEADFKASGLAARGWVVLAYNWDDGRLHNYSTDYHTQGVWNCTPLLVLDVYEHAYFLDFATARKAYIEAFMKNVDWAFCAGLVTKYGVAEHRKKHFS